MSSRTQEFVEFALHEPRTAIWSFRNYFDKDYNDKFLVKGKSSRGFDLQASIKWHPNTRIIRIPANKTDLNHNKYADFIRNSPHCKGSPLCIGEGMFYEINPVKDAKVKLEEEIIRVRAVNYALEVEGDKLNQLANYAGCFHNDEDVQRSAVIDFAKLKSREFNALADSPSITYAALYKSALNAGVIQSKGFNKEAVIKGNVISLGNEKSAIDKLTNDKGLFESIKNEVKELKDKK